MIIPLTQLELFQLVSHFEEKEGTLFLYSGKEGPAYLALFPRKVIHVTGGNHPWESLKKQFPPLSGRSEPEWIGFFNYEMGAFVDPEKEISTPYPPEAYLQKSAVLLTYDPFTETAQISLDCADPRIGCLRDPDEWLRLAKQGKPFPHPAQGTLRVLESKASYLQKINAIQEKISAGEVYQVSLSQAFHVENCAPPYPFFCKLMEINPVPFAAYLRLKDRVIISASPERLLAYREGILETNPIKGTIPRGKTPQEDEQHKQALLTSQKNRAELLMIVDLLRNDLGKISLSGSVNTSQLQEIIAYPHLYHTQATIKATPQPHLSPIDLLKSCFPGGSITGCPKLSALQIIADLEKRARKSYTGTIGYFKGNGDFDWNVAIRTIEVEGNRALIQLGGAIVSDSDPEEEYEETLIKGKPLFAAMGVG